MIRHPALREIVGADFLRAVSGSDLASAKLRLRIMPLLLLHVIELGPQQGKGLGLVLKLGLLRLAVNHNPGGIVGEPHCGVRGIDALTAVSGSPHNINPDVLIVDHNVNIFIHLRHNRHTDGGCVDSPAGLGFRHPLYPMYAAFIFQPGISSLSGNHKIDFLHAADADFIHIHGFHPPPLALRIVYIEPVNLRREQGCLVPAGPCPDLHDYVLLVIGILRQKKNL